MALTSQTASYRSLLVGCVLAMAAAAANQAVTNATRSCARTMVPTRLERVIPDSTDSDAVNKSKSQAQGCGAGACRGGGPGGGKPRAQEGMQNDVHGDCSDFASV